MIAARGPAGEIEEELPRRPPRATSLSALAPVAGPVLIVSSILLVLHDFAFRGMVTDQHLDLLSFWLPNHCFLGRSLAEGIIPSWNPYVMAGLPFAADPQSGWMYLPAMALYSVFSCDVAVRLFVLVQPMIAGLGLYWFCRSEQLSRIAATIGGLSLALAIAASSLAVSLPLAGSFAWTAVLLALLSRFLRASSWSARLGWALLAALAWGQLAAAHLSNGILLGTSVALAYMIARGISDARAGRRAVREAALLLALLAVLLVPVNFAYLLPRLSYLTRSSLGLGYDGLTQLAARLGAPVAETVQSAGSSPSWPLRFGVSPGAYLGALPLALCFGGLWSRRHRAVAIAFAVVGVLSYLPSLDVVVQWSAPLVRDIPLSDFYLHEPERFGYGVFLVIPVLGAIGVDAWRTSGSVRERFLLPALGILVWVGLPLLLSVDPARLLLLAGGGAAGLGLLAAVRHRPMLALLLPGVLAIELVVNGLVGQAATGEVRLAIELGNGADLPFVNLMEPQIEAADYMHGGRIVSVLGSHTGRLLRVGSPYGSEAPRSRYLSTWHSADRGYVNNQRAILFAVEDGEGYNPVQLRPYWTFVRRVSAVRMKYNRAVLKDPSPATLDLLDVRWIVGPTGDPPAPGLTPVVAEGRWTLYSRTGSVRASLISRWMVIPDDDRAIEAVTEDGFDPSDLVILDEAPGMGAPIVPVRPGEAEFEWLGTGEARVNVQAAAAAVLLIRNAYDPKWRATLDGEPVEVLRADFLLQGIPVPPGRHVVLLFHQDPTIALGLVGSGASVGVSLAVGLVLWIRERRPHSR